MGEDYTVWKQHLWHRMAVWPRLVLQVVFEQHTCLQAAGRERIRTQRISITSAAHARQKLWIHPLSSELSIDHEIRSEGDHRQREGRWLQSEHSYDARTMLFDAAKVHGST